MMEFKKFGEDVVKLEKSTVLLQWAFGNTLWRGELVDGTREQYIDLHGNAELAQQRLYDLLKRKQAEAIGV
jgi:hypothetical protein